MTLNNKIKQSGFTIVELLIVIVVIGILAAITIVAFNGIQNRGRTTSAQSSAATLQKKVEAYNSVTGAYPGTGATTAMATVPEATLSGSGLTIGTPTAATGEKTVRLELCTAPAGATGYRIAYWDYTTGAVPASASSQIQGGTNATACTTYSAAT